MPSFFIAQRVKRARVDEDVQATGKRRVGPLEAQPLCGLRHVRQEPAYCIQCLSDVVSSFLCMHLCLCMFLFLAGDARGEIDDAHVPPRLPSWENYLNRTSVDAFHDQI
jgi:hypothetical protein